jgi:hypothetical protein
MSSRFCEILLFANKQSKNIGINFFMLFEILGTKVLDYSKKIKWYLKLDFNFKNAIKEK